MLEVNPGVGGLREAHQAVTGTVVEPPGRGAAAVPMHEGGRAAIAVRSSQSPDLADGTPEKAGGLGHEELAAFHGIQDHQALLGTLASEESPPHSCPLAFARERGGHFH